MRKIFSFNIPNLSGGLTLSLLLSAASTEASSSIDEGVAQIRSAEAERARALVDADADKLRAMTSVDYVHVESNGKLRTLDEFIQGLVDAEYRFKSFTIDKLSITVERNIAIATGDYHNDIITKSGLQPTKYARFTRVWRFENGRWKNLTHQATEYQP